MEQPALPCDAFIEKTIRKAGRDPIRYAVAVKAKMLQLYPGLAAEEGRTINDEATVREALAHIVQMELLSS